MLCCSHWWHKTSIYGDFWVFVTLPLGCYVASVHQALETLRFYYEYEFDCEYDFLETFRFDYEYKFD